MGKLLCFYIGKQRQKKAEKSQKIVQSNRRVSLCSNSSVHFGFCRHFECVLLNMIVKLHCEVVLLSMVLDVFC